MKILIVGAGTIGLTYGYLLSQEHDVEFLVKESHLHRYGSSISLVLKDLRKGEKEFQEWIFQPRIVTEITDSYDLILLTVNSLQLEETAAMLSEYQEQSQILIMQNNWDIEGKLSAYLSRENYLLVFPSSVGGGRIQGQIRATVFQAKTLVEARSSNGLALELFASIQIPVKEVAEMAAWLKVHCLQEAVMAGALAEAGKLASLLGSNQAVRKMLEAWREGLALCESYQISRYSYKPSKYLQLPLFLLVPLVKSSLRQPLVYEMIEGHLASGFQEWAAQYFEILASAKERGIAMPVWESYAASVKKFLRSFRV